MLLLPLNVKLVLAECGGMLLEKTYQNCLINMKTTSFKGSILLCLYISLLNPSKHNINEIRIITFNGFWEPSSGKIQ
jgi:hypothetical protein